MFIVTFCRDRGINGLFNETFIEYAENVTCRKIYTEVTKTNKLVNVDGVRQLVGCDPYTVTELSHIEVKCFKEAGEQRDVAPTYTVDYKKSTGRWEHFYIRDARTGYLFTLSGY